MQTNTSTFPGLETHPDKLTPEQWDRLKKADLFYQACYYARWEHLIRRRNERKKRK